MLRPIKTRHLDPRMFTGQLTCSGTNTVVSNLGGNDVLTSTEASAGLPIVTLKQGFRRIPVVVATPGTSVTTAGYCELIAASTNPAFSARINNTSGTAIDGTMDYLVFGWNAADLSRGSAQRVFTSKRRSRIIGAKVTTSGGVATVAIGKSDFTVTRASQGVYTVVFKNAFGLVPTVLAIGINSTVVRSPVVTSKTAAGCTVTFADHTPAVQDADFYLLVTGTDMRDEHGGAFAEIDNSQRKPRIVAGQITVTAGTPAYTINSNEFSSVTDNGTGDFTINLIDAFRQECIVMATARTGRVHVHTGSASAPRLIARNAGGTAADPTTIDFILVGSDDPSEY